MIIRGLKDKNILILIGVFILSLPLIQPWLRGDGINYYAYIRSLVIDRDLQFGNEFSDAVELNRLGPPLLSGIKDYRPSDSLGVPETLLSLTKTDHIRNRMSVGTSLLWSPFFLLAHFLVIILNRFGIGIPADGYSFPYIFLVSLGSCLYAFIGLILAYKISCRYLSHNISLGVTLAIWWASPLPAYMYGHPMLSHTGSVFAISLLLFLYLKDKEKESRGRWLAMGIISGLAVIVRIQDSLFLLIPGAEILRQYYLAVKHRKSSDRLKTINQSILFLIGFLSGLLPQLIVGKILYGVYSLDFYHQMQKEMAWEWFSPPIPQVLFSSCHGLFSWTPLLLPAISGLYFFYKKDRGLAIILILIFLLQLYVISGGYSRLTGRYIWEYSSFGGRMFLSLIPVFIIGLGALVERLKTKLRAGWLILLGGGFILWNMGFILQFALGLVPRQDRISWLKMIHNQFAVIPLLLYRKMAGQFLFFILILLMAGISGLFYLRKKKRLIKTGDV